MEDFDLKEFARMFDTALASDNPAVKKALRNFMMVTALVHSQEDAENNKESAGPLETLLKQLDDLQSRLAIVEAERYKTTQTYPLGPYDNTWIYNGTYPTVTSTISAKKDWKFTSNDIDDYNTSIEKYLNDAISKKGSE